MGGRKQPRIADSDFIQLFTTLGASKMQARGLGSARAIYDRRARLEKRLGYQLNSADNGGNFRTRHNVSHAARVALDILNGVVLIGSDAHIWPGPSTIAMRGFVKFASELKPKALILNGDVVDLPQVSRHPPITWENHSTVAQEIEAAQERLSEIEDAVSSNCKLTWTLGNHDSRFETRLATVAPEYAKMHGVHLKDHFGVRWQPCWATWINDNTVVKHRFKGGIHAPHNNTIYSGKHMVTGHLHSARVSPFTDYNGTRYGVDTGCLADPNAEAFLAYTEDSPKNWRSAFAVLTYHKGELLQPELVLVHDKRHVQFRGELIEV